MKDILRLCVSLGLVCLVGAGALAYVNNVTDGPRKAAAKATLTDGLKLVLPLETATIASNDEDVFLPALTSTGTTPLSCSIMKSISPSLGDFW